MRVGQGRSSRWTGFLASLAALAFGCATPRAQIEQALRADRPPPAHLGDIARACEVHCSDVLDVAIAGQLVLGGPRRVGPDGRIDLGDAGRPRVDGQTPTQIVRTVAESFGVPPDQVRVRIAEHNSQYLYLFGQVAGAQRAVPYQGPETVLDLLHRVGGLPPSAALYDIQVVRPHVADGKAPEIFRIDLAAIVLRNDAETNIVLQPYDQIHIGQSRRSRFGDCLPPWLRPVYGRACGMKRSEPPP